MQEGVTQKQ